MRMFIASLLVLIMLAQPVLALDVGITPDSPLYPIKRLLENLDLLFTFDEVSKVEKMLKYAKLRIAEAEKMAEEGKDEYVSGLLKDYTNYLQNAVELIKSAKPKDAPKIAELIVNESLNNLKELDELSAMCKDDEIKLAKIQTIRQSELAIEMLKDPLDAYKLNLRLTNGLLKIANEKTMKGENADLLLKESDRLMKQSEEILKRAKKTGGIPNPENIVEEIKEIIDEATNISIIKNPEERNVTVDIIEKGLNIYKKLGVKSIIQ